MRRSIFILPAVVCLVLAYTATTLDTRPELNIAQESKISVNSYESCVENFESTSSAPPECHTDDGRTYVEPIEYDYPSSHPKFLKKVSSYSECRKIYDTYRFEDIYKPEICVDKNGLSFTAGGEDRAVNSYAECATAGGPIGDNGSPAKCYNDGVVYYQVVNDAEYLNPPVELLAFSDCVVPGIVENIDIIGDKVFCDAFNGQRYIYTGPAVKTYEDCARVMRFVLQSNPPQCYGPDGTHFTGAAYIRSAWGVEIMKR